MATMYKLMIAVLAQDGNEIARGVIDAKVTANGNLYAAWQELKPVNGAELPFAIQATAMPSKYASTASVLAWAQANRGAIMAEIARKSGGSSKPAPRAPEKAKVDVRSLIAQTLGAELPKPAAELPKPAANAVLAGSAAGGAKPVFVMRADVRKLVNDGRVPAADAEAFQALCDSTTKTASEVLAELGAGRAGGASRNGKKAKVAA